MLQVDNKTLNSWERLKDSDIYFSFIKSPTIIILSFVNSFLCRNKETKSFNSLIVLSVFICNPLLIHQRTYTPYYTSGYQHLLQNQQNC